MNRRLTLLVTVIAALALMITACQSSDPETPEPEPTAESVENTESAEASAADANQASKIFETTWTVQSFGGPEEPIPGVDGTYPSINFMAARYEGYTGCNYFVGSYRVDGENKVRLDPPAVTKAVCEDEAIKNQQEWYLTLLVTTDEYAFDGETITLSGGGKQLMTLEPLEPAPFEGTTWNYRFYQGQHPSWQPALPDTSITAVFDGETISGSAGCNDYTGSYTMNENEIAISEVVATRMMCAEPTDIMEQETRYLSALETATHIQISARGVQLFDAEKPIMLFSAD